MKPLFSILISTKNRLALWKRTLWAIARRPPLCPFEVVVADDGSTEDVLGELRTYSAVIPWKFVRVDTAEFTRKTGVVHYFNNPALTNNVAFRHCSGDLVCLQGNEVVVWDDCYERLRADIPEGTRNWMVFSTTHDVPGHLLATLDCQGTNLHERVVEATQEWPLQSEDYRSDVVNYCSLVPRTLWETLGGFDERYLAGISAEDSDFVRRARALHGFVSVVSPALSLHQSHGGRTRYYWPKPSVIERDRFEHGCQVNRRLYDSWDGSYHNRQPWPPGTHGVVEVVTP